MSNIALVVLDTLRKDAFDRHFDWLPGRRFERAYSTANWTVPAHASLFTGQYASEVGIHAKNTRCDCSTPVLAEQLQSTGYATSAFSANANITGHFDFDRGFSRFDSPKQYDFLDDERIFDWHKYNSETQATGVRRYLNGVYKCVNSDKATIPSLLAGVRALRDSGTGVEFGGIIEAREVVEEMDFGDEEFLFINVMEAHEPYRAPEKYQTVAEPALTKSVGDLNEEAIDAEQTEQAYEDCVRYLSDAYSELFETLQQDFEYIVTLSDHGEMLGEHGAWGHEHGVYPELTHIPLCIYGDDMDGTCNETVSLIDVYETVLDVAGIADESNGRGQSLVEDIEEDERLAEYLGLTSWSERRIRKHWSERRMKQYEQELRGYAGLGDCYGYETVDGFVTTGQEGSEATHDRLQQLVETLEIREVRTQNEVPEEIQDRLEHLGYA